MPVTLLLVAPLVDHIPLPLWYGLSALTMGLAGLIWWRLMHLDKADVLMNSGRSLDGKKDLDAGVVEA